MLLFPSQPNYCWRLVISLYFSVITLALAQNPIDIGPAIKFGKITPDQFLTVMPDSTAEAIVLYDYGEEGFDINTNGLLLVLTHHVRLQIRKKSAYDRATIQLIARRGLAGQHEFVSAFDGYTYNLVNGNIATERLTKGGHFTEKISDQYWVEKYTLPNVREGSIIEYQYTIRTPFSINHNPKIWHFQQDIPVKWSEYRIFIPNFFYYSVIQSGYLDITADEHKSSSESVYRFVIKDAPAFRQEAYITTSDDYLAKVEFELASYQLPGQMLKQVTVSWDALDKTLLDDDSFGGQIKRTGFLEETAKSLLHTHVDTVDRIIAAYDYIRHTIKWNEKVSFWSRNIKKVFDDKKGDAADINLLLIALFREMGIDANPLILSTRSHGRIDTSYPLVKKFNYVIAQVSIAGKDILLDATDPYLTPGTLPFHCLNGTGRLVHPSKSRFISLTSTDRHIEVRTSSLSINEDGDVAGKVVHSHGGYSAWSARKQFAVGGKTKYLEDIQKKYPTWQIEKADFVGGDRTNGAFNADYIIRIPEAGSRAGDRLYFNPMLTEEHIDNPFKEAQRFYPVDFGIPLDNTFTATYTLPIGFQVEEIPKPVSMALPEEGGRFQYKVIVNDANQLQVVSRIVLRRPIYSAEEYGPLRELFSRIVAKHAEQIVLKRGVIVDKK